MVIKWNEQYNNGGSLPDIFMLTPAPIIAWMIIWYIDIVYYYDLLKVLYVLLLCCILSLLRLVAWYGD